MSRALKSASIPSSLIPIHDLVRISSKFSFYASRLLFLDKCSPARIAALAKHCKEIYMFNAVKPSCRHSTNSALSVFGTQTYASGFSSAKFKAETASSSARLQLVPTSKLTTSAYISPRTSPTPTHLHTTQISTPMPEHSERTQLLQTWHFKLGHGPLGTTHIMAENDFTYAFSHIGQLPKDDQLKCMPCLQTTTTGTQEHITHPSKKQTNFTGYEGPHFTTSAHAQPEMFNYLSEHRHKIPVQSTTGRTQSSSRCQSAAYCTDPQPYQLLPTVIPLQQC